MTKANKQAKRKVIAKAFSEARKRGEKGPCKTRTSDTFKKKNCWWQKFPSYSAYISGGKKAPKRETEAV